MIAHSAIKIRLASSTAGTPASPPCTKSGMRRCASKARNRRKSRVPLHQVPEGAPDRGPQQHLPAPPRHPSPGPPSRPRRPHALGRPASSPAACSDAAVLPVTRSCTGDSGTARGRPPCTSPAPRWRCSRPPDRWRGRGRSGCGRPPSVPAPGCRTPAASPRSRRG